MSPLDVGRAIGMSKGGASKLIDRLVIMNIPHPAIMLKAIAKPPQLFRSWYMFAFQLPVLPELFLTANNAAGTAAILKGALVDKTAMSEADIDQYRKAMTKPGAATAQLNYYRNILGAPRGRGFHKLEMPTLLVWGEEDIVLGHLVAGLGGDLPHITDQLCFDFDHCCIPDFLMLTEHVRHFVR